MIKKILHVLVKIFSKPSILFESVPIFTDNTKAVYDEMVRRSYDKKYNLFWYIDWNTCAVIKDSTIQYIDLSNRKTIKQKLISYSYYNKTKAIICCNKFIPSSGENRVTFGADQISFYLSHGNPIKSVKNYYSAPGGIDFAVCASEAMREIVADEIKIDPDRFFVGGFPRNDTFSQQKISLQEKLNIKNRKVIIWYPTYRQNCSGAVALPGSSLPIIHDIKNAIKVNETAKNEDILIILKPHFAQDVSLISKIRLSNIWLIDDDFYKKNGISSYEVLAASDGLITDYSSVYYDYTLCDKPIAVIWEDIDSYRQFPGFAVDVDYYLKGAEKIYHVDQLCEFITNVSQGIDRLKKERREIRDVANISTDGKNAKRVVDFISSKIS